jgi:trehalose-phosphatase
MRSSARGLDPALAAWHSRPHQVRPIVLMDFDGTLADFEVDPTRVKLTGERLALLQMLAARSDLSAGIVSGRRIADLRERTLGGPTFFYAGLHGLEIEGPGLRYTHPAIALAAPTLGVLSAELNEAIKSLDGVLIEDKGLAVVMHTRGASKADRLHAATRFTALAEPFLNDGTLRLQPGDHILELLPNIDWAKGDAVRIILRHVEGQHRQNAWPIYIGDDETDEDAFEEIGDAGMTVAVGTRMASASFALPDPATVEHFLRQILATD